MDTQHEEVLKTKQVFPNVDDWEREDPKEAYVFTDGKNVKLNLDKIVPKSRRRMSAEDKEMMNSLQTFIIERKLFMKKTDLICHYIDYFIEYFDEDKELPYAYMYIKDKLDSTPISLTINEFLKIVNARFFRDTNIKNNIYRMVDANYNLDVSVDAKTGRLFTGTFDFTNDEAKQLLAVSIFMKMIIPVASQYIVTNTLYTEDILNNLITQVFVDSFYRMGSRKLDSEADDLLLKLYKFTENKINKHYGLNQTLWHQQTALRGLTELKHTDTILIKHLLSNNMFKFKFDNNIISFLKSIVETQLMCTINKVKYKVNPVRVDNVVDYQGLSGIDKLEQSLAKLDETQIIRCEKSLDEMIDRYIEIVGPIDDEEIDYYMNNFNTTDPFHNKLICYYFAKEFDGYIELKNKTVYQYFKLLIIAKRQLVSEGYKELPHLLSSVQIGRTSMRKLQNTKFINKLTTASTYENMMKHKYNALEGFHEDEVLSLISQILNNVYCYVEYEDQELTGKTIEFTEDIISDEIITFIDNI